MGLILFWLILSIAALAADVVTSSFFLSGFTIGGIFALLAKVWKFEFGAQAIVFVLVSAGAIAGEYLWLRVKLKKMIPMTMKMEEEYIGRKLSADEDIHSRGRIKIDGGVIHRGDRFEITGIKGSKIIVKKEDPA